MPLTTWKTHLPDAHLLIISTWLDNQVDADMMRVWFEENGVNAKNIKTLIGAEASRERIIGAIRAFLIDNDTITKDSPIIIYFSGHGARLQQPPGWVNDGGEEYVECLVPADAILPDSVTTEENGEVFPLSPGTKLKDVSFAIPDRTLFGLLHQLHDRRGNNVLVALDCCHSGHATRGSTEYGKANFFSRSVDPERLRPLPRDLDEDILSNTPADDSNAESQRGAVFRRQNESHILFAATRRDEDAWGSDEGGLFTRALLKALNELDVWGRFNYDDLHRRLCERYRDLLRDYLALCRQYRIDADQTPREQHPQCEGTFRGRWIFDTHGTGMRWFTVQPLDAHAPGGGRTRCQIHVGADAGVREGHTIFALCKTLDTGKTVAVVRAVARSVQPQLCIAELESTVPVFAVGMSAFVVPEPLKIAIRGSSSTALSTFQSCLSTASSDELASFIESDVEHADVVFNIDQKGALVEPQHPAVRELRLAPPRVDVADFQPSFPAAFPMMAHYKQCLTMENPESNLTIDIALHKLEVVDDDDDDDCLPIGDQVPFVDGEATVRHSPETNHALMLYNQSDTDLFPYVFLLEPSTYEVQLFYTPKNSDDAPLKGQSSLQLGRSEEHYGTMYFTVPEGQMRDGSILKVFVTTRAQDLTGMRQRAVLGHDEYDDLNLMKHRDSDEATRLTSTVLMAGDWASFTRRIVVEP
jgi:hypothetical protein